MNDCLRGNDGPIDHDYIHLELQELAKVRTMLNERARVRTHYPDCHKSPSHGDCLAYRLLGQAEYAYRALLKEQP